MVCQAGSERTVASAARLDFLGPTSDSIPHLGLIFDEGAMVSDEELEAAILAAKQPSSSWSLIIRKEWDKFWQERKEHLTFSQLERLKHLDLDAQEQFEFMERVRGKTGLPKMAEPPPTLVEMGLGRGVIDPKWLERAKTQLSTTDLDRLVPFIHPYLSDDELLDLVVAIETPGKASLVEKTRLGRHFLAGIYGFYGAMMGSGILASTGLLDGIDHPAVLMTSLLFGAGVHMGTPCGSFDTIGSMARPPGLQFTVSLAQSSTNGSKRKT